MSDAPLLIQTPSHRGTWLAVALLAMLGLAAYSNTFAVPFLFDDEESISLNPTIRNLWPPGPIFLPWAQGVTVAGRPIVNLSLAINYALGGVEVRGYHVFNLAIHLLAGLTLFGLIRRTLLLPQFAEGPGRRATGLSLTCSLLWTFHPLQTESVTYVIQRAESLVGLFYLLTLYAVIRGATAKTDRSENGWYAAAIGTCFLGVGCKEVMATAPVVVLLYDRFFLAGSFSAAWTRRRGLYFGLASGWIVQAGLVFSAGSRGGSAGFTVGVSPWQYAGTQFGAILNYLRLTIWPSPLVFDYGKTLADTVPAVLFPAFGVVLLAFAVGLSARRYPWVGFVALAAALILAPSSSIVPIATQSMAEHRMYLPLAAVIVLAVFGIDGLLSRMSSARSVAHPATTPPQVTIRGISVAILVVACAIATRVRNQDYRSALTIWEDTVTKRPTNARARNNYGHELLKLKRPEEAFRQFDQAIALKQRECEPYFNRSILYEEQGKLAKALEDMDQATRYCSSNKSYAIRRGTLLEKSGRFEEAATEFTRALALEPGATLILFERGNCYAILGRHEEAIRDFTQIIAREPNVDRAWHNRGNSNAALGRLPESIHDLSKAIELRPELPDPYRNRAISYFEMRQYARAWEDVDRCRAQGGSVDPGLLQSLERAAPRAKGKG